MHLAAKFWVLSLPVLAAGCSPTLIEEPSIEFNLVIEGATGNGPEIELFAERHDYPVRDTMIGDDGLTSFMLARHGATILFLPDLDCPSAVMQVSAMKEYPASDWSAVEQAAVALTQTFGERLRQKQAGRACPQ